MDTQKIVSALNKSGYAAESLNKDEFSVNDTPVKLIAGGAVIDGRFHSCKNAKGLFVNLWMGDLVNEKDLVNLTKNYNS